MNKRQTQMMKHEVTMKRGDIVELTKDMIPYYKVGRRAHFIRISKNNPKDAEIVWFGEEETFNTYGDVELVPLDMLRLVTEN